MQQNRRAEARRTCTRVRGALALGHEGRSSASMPWSIRNAPAATRCPISRAVSSRAARPWCSCATSMAPPARWSSARAPSRRRSQAPAFRCSSTTASMWRSRPAPTASTSAGTTWRPRTRGRCSGRTRSIGLSIKTVAQARRRAARVARLCLHRRRVCHGLEGQHQRADRGCGRRARSWPSSARALRRLSGRSDRRHRRRQCGRRDRGRRRRRRRHRGAVA